MTACAPASKLPGMLHDIHARQIQDDRLRDAGRFALLHRALTERRERRAARAAARPAERLQPARPEATPQRSAA